MKPLLPPLKDDHAIVKPSTAGKWIKEDNSLLKRISEGLKTNEIEENVEDLISIPDVWARATVVKNALYDTSHSLNKRIKNEWRGLLAVIALAPYHKKNLHHNKDQVNKQNLIVILSLI